MASSVSAIFGVRIATVSFGANKASAGSGLAERIECSSRPQKKGTKHHMKTRPKKTSPWDVKRKPTVYPAIPLLPAEWTLVSATEEEPTEGA